MARFTNSISGRPVPGRLTPTGRCTRSSRRPPVNRCITAWSREPHFGENHTLPFFGTGDQESPVSDAQAGKFYAVKDTDSVHGADHGGQPGRPVDQPRHRHERSDAVRLVHQLDQHTVPAKTAPADTTYTHTGRRSSPTRWSFSTTSFSRRTPPTHRIRAAAAGSRGCTGSRCLNATSALASITSLGETSNSKVSYHVVCRERGRHSFKPVPFDLSVRPVVDLRRVLYGRRKGDQDRVAAADEDDQVMEREVLTMAGSATWRRARRRIAALFLAFCLIASVAGCGKKEGQSPQGDPGRPEAPVRRMPPAGLARDPYRFRPVVVSRSSWRPTLRAGSLRRPFPSSRPRNTGPKFSSSGGLSTEASRRAVRSFRLPVFNAGTGSGQP